MKSANSYVNRRGHYADFVCLFVCPQDILSTKFKSYFLKLFYIGGHRTTHSISGFGISKAKKKKC